jgi:hypothetical protein
MQRNTLNKICWRHCRTVSFSVCQNLQPTKRQNVPSSCVQKSALPVSWTGTDKVEMCFIIVLGVVSRFCLLCCVAYERYCFPQVKFTLIIFSTYDGVTAVKCSLVIKPTWYLKYYQLKTVSTIIKNKEINPKKTTFRTDNHYRDINCLII